MLPITNLTETDAKRIRFVLTDIDDTLTKDGRLLPEAYSALWDLRNAGIRVIPVTGRPAGWCDLIIRQWPVDAVVGENGAFVYYFEDNQLKTFTHPSVANIDVKTKLKEIEKAVLSEVPGTRVAKDQFSRLYDLAIDFAEDPPFLGLEAAEEIKSVCERFGAIAKISSIHVNTWFGDYDKLSMVRLFLKEFYDSSDPIDQVLYFGDSPNDEPMFSYFTYGCGVSNIQDYLHLMTDHPNYLCSKEFGLGFAEGVHHILSFLEKD